MHSPPDPSHPVILVLDHSPVVPKIIRLMLKREAELSVQIVAFTDPTLAARWLTGSLDQQKAATYPLPTPWDHYPPLAQTQVGLAILDSEFEPVRGLPVIDWIAALLPTGTPIVTISSESAPARRRRHSKLPLLAHLHKPLETHALIAQLAPVLASELPTALITVVPKQQKQWWAIHRLLCWLRWW